MAPSPIDAPNEAAAPGVAPGTPEQYAGTQAPPGPAETLFGLDSYTWIGFAFLCFVAVLWRFGAFRLIGSALDDQAARVRADLAEAAALKAEAEAMKAGAAAEAAEAKARSEAMIANAEVEAGRIVAQAAVDAEAAIARRTRMAEDRIAAETRGAEAALRARAADLAVRAAETLIAERAGRPELAALTDSAIASLDRR